MRQNIWLRASLFLSLAFASLSFSANAQSGIFESYAIINTGGSDIFYDLQATTGNPDFNGANLGSFVQCSGTLRLDGGQNKTFKCPPCDITNGTLHYRVYPTGSPSGAFTMVNLPYAANLGTGCSGNDQRWEENAANINLLSNRAPGNYTLEVYTSANYQSCGSGTHFSNNGGANYSATFTVTGNATCPVFVAASGGTAFATYTTLKGAFDAVNAGTHTGTIAITIGANTTETATAALNASGTGSANYTSVLVKPGASPVTVSGSIAGAIVRLNGADNVTIDGRISGSGRNLTIQNTNTSAATAAIWLSSNGVGAGATSNTIRNLELACGATQNTSTNATFGIIMCGTSISTTSNGDDNDNNTFTENRIIRCRYGITTRGVTSNNNQNIMVTNNIVGPSSFGADEIGKVGIFMQADNMSTVSGNTVQFVGGDYANTSGGADRVGIAIGTESWSMSPSTITSGNYTVSNNIVHDVIEERTFSSVGIALATTRGGSPTNNIVANNFIYNIKSNGTGGDQVVGLGIAGGHTDKVVFNSIFLSGDVDPNPSATSTSTFGSGIRIANTNGTTHANLTLMNNNVSIDLTSSSNSGVHYYAISGPIDSYSFGTGGENFNNYYINPSNPQVRTGGIGATGTATLTIPYTTLANWQTAYSTPQDANSIQVNPPFVSGADLHLVNGSNTPLESGGIAIAGVTTDIDNQTRPNGFAPDIGADEFSGTNPNLCAGTPAAGTASAMTALICGTSGNSTLSLTGFTSGTGITYQWKSSPTAGGPYTDIMGATMTSYNAMGITSTTYYVITTTCAGSGMSATSNEVAVVVAPAVTATISPASATICEGDDQLLTASPSGSGQTYLWSTSETTQEITVAPTSTTTYSVVVTATSGCTGMANATVTVNPVPDNPMAAASDTDICQGEMINLSASADAVSSTALSENFNSGAPGWTTINNSTGGTPANAAWTIRTSPYLYTTTTFNSGDAQFYMSNSDAQGSASTTNTILQSPAFSTLNYTSLNLAFSHHYRDIGDAGDNGYVEVSTNGTDWTTVQTYTSNQGGADAFLAANINLDAYIGNPAVYIRFRYVATWDWYWAIDQVVVTGNAPDYTYNWTSNPAGFTSSDQNPTNVAPTVNTTYTVEITNSNGCSATASVMVNVAPTTIWYQDSDMDTYGNPSVTQMACIQPMGYVANNTDCNDNNASINPAAMEICDGVDNNCNMMIDDGLTFVTYYTDADNDGYGTGAGQSLCANPGAGFATQAGDCNDADDQINPGASEVCDGVDNNCNMMIDDGLIFVTYYTDADNDGYGTGAGQSLCANPGAGFATQAGDCNDNNHLINPGAQEICDGIDNNCNMMTDEGVQTTYYRDMDGDGFGDPSVTQMACSQPMGYVTNNTDCDDNDALEKPGQVWYKDADGDDYSDGMTLTQCLRPTNYYVAAELIAVMGDCDDTDPAINPGATEIVNGIDDNCNGATDENGITYYRDMDGDGFGDPNNTVFAGSQPPGYVLDNTDCLDTDSSVHPNAMETCDGCDKDCDGFTGDDVAPVSCGLPTPANCVGQQSCILTPVPFPGACLPGGGTYTGCNNIPLPEVCDGIDNDCDSVIDDGVGGMPCVPAGTPPGLVYGGTSQCQMGVSVCINGVIVCTGFVGPSAEICDGIDNDCDGNVDEEGQFTWYRDMDNDGFGNPSVTQMACTQPMGYVANNTDCDDNDALEKPGQVWYADVDNDNYSSGTTLTQCLRPAGYKVASELTATSGDCNDNNAAINPAATEICDGVDNNCNMMTDEGVQTTYYRDMDGDGFGNPAVTQMACSQPMGYVTNNTDCDDNDALEKPGQVWYADVDNDNYSSGTTLTQCLRPAGYKVASELTATTGDCNDGNAAINPAATEICDGIDNNCNSMTDEGVQTTYYRDMDGDGFGNPAMTQMACSQPMGYVSNNTDCDDNDALEKPGQIWYADVDNDNYSSGTTLTQCLRPAGYKVASELTATTGDCNDNNAAINPGATEICDGVDNNCNSMTDEGVQTTYYRDMDGDGFGDPLVTQMACSQPMGYVTNNTDCDDNDALEKPSQVWYKDSDNDNYAETGAATIIQCLRPAGYKAASELTSTTGDCNDGNAAINPAATEVCDGVDNNCNSMTDEGVQTTYYRDMDGDGFGNPSVTQIACSQPMGYVINNTDCDDNDALEKPGQVWYKDADGDDYSDGMTLTQCLRPTNYYVAAELIATSGDCNDNNAAINPGATEICDGIDNNCNSMTDEGVQTTYYRDMDGDGFGNPSMTQMACTQPTGYVTNNTDCDDNDALEKPGQAWYADVDNDGYSNGTTLTQCLRPAGYKVASELTATTGDCNDNNAAINPVALEICNGVDDNCDGVEDEGVKTTYYRDLDGDGFGDINTMTIECSQPTGYVENSEDCDDTDDEVYPGAEEICDSKDNDCNGTIDDIGGTTIGNWIRGDVGDANGSSSFPPCNAEPTDVFTLSSTGFSTSSSDKLHVVYQELCGNGEIIARVLNISGGGWAGIMLRETLNPGSKKVSLKVQANGSIRREIRMVTNGAVNNLNFNRPTHVWLRLTRNGSTFVGYTSPDGSNWTFAFSASVSMNGCIYAGLFSESINASAPTTVTFDNVSIIRPNSNLSIELAQPANLNDQTPQLDMNIYPNPGNGEMTLTVQSATDRPLNLKVMDAFGKIIRNIELNEGTAFNYSLDLSGEPAGIYYLRLRSDDGEENVQRIVLQR